MLNNNSFSKTGLVLGGLYIIFAGYFIYHGLTCNSDMYCGFSALMPIVPWPIVMDYVNSSLLRNILDNAGGLIFFSVINAVIIYHIGKLIGFMFNKIRG